MAIEQSWREWWRGFLGFSIDMRPKALGVLNDRYIKESQHTARLKLHAERMHYPQFRDKLLAIASDKAKHGEWIAEKINLLGGKLPHVPVVTDTGKTTWQFLSETLNEEQQSAAELIEQSHNFRSEFPDVAEVLERIYEDAKRHRESLREMLMRSDPQSHLSYLS